MDKKAYTLLIFSGARGKVHKIQIPVFMVRLALIAGVVVLLAAGLMATSYARMLWKVANYNDVRNEREALKTQYKALKSTVKQTDAKLASLQTLASEVAIAYGFRRARQPGYPEVLTDFESPANLIPASGYRASMDLLYALATGAASRNWRGLSRGLASGYLLTGASMPSIWPVRGEVTRGFGVNQDPFSGQEVFHPGVDIAAPYGTRVEAAGNGMVVEAGWDAGYGKCILIDHGSGVETRYAHLSRIFVIVGEQVSKGQIIGAVGSTGYSTGPHLHYEVLIHNTPVNPFRFLHKRTFLASRGPIKQGS